jgi:hypothetical protein
MITEHVYSMFSAQAPLNPDVVITSEEEDMFRVGQVTRQVGARFAVGTALFPSE